MVTKEAQVVISELSEHVNAQAKVVGLIHPKGEVDTASPTKAV